MRPIYGVLVIVVLFVSVNGGIFGKLKQDIDNVRKDVRNMAKGVRCNAHKVGNTIFAHNHKIDLCGPSDELEANTKTEADNKKTDLETENIEKPDKYKNIQDKPLDEKQTPLKVTEHKDVSEHKDVPKSEEKGVDNKTTHPATDLKHKDDISSIDTKIINDLLNSQNPLENQVDPKKITKPNEENVTDNKKNLLDPNTTQKDRRLSSLPDVPSDFRIQDNENYVSVVDNNNNGNPKKPKKFNDNDAIKYGDLGPTVSSIDPIDVRFTKNNGTEKNETAASGTATKPLPSTREQLGGKGRHLIKPSCVEGFARDPATDECVEVFD